MITRYTSFLEKYDTGLFRYDNKPLKLKVSYDGKITNVKITYMDKYYEDLSVTIPDSKDLDKDEFFLNPDIDKNLVNELVNQGFIEKSDKESMAGNKKTTSYTLI